MSKFTINGEYKNIYFIGIGGVSMSALALILKNKNYNVCGSDMNQSATVLKLKLSGINVNIGQITSNISTEYDLIVHSAAIKEDNEELCEARRLKIPVIDRAYLLGLVMKNYDNPIAISGTHGKSTTTSMVSEIFFKSQLNPTITVGGNLPSIDGNLYLGDSKYFIFESCEYFDSFLKFYPQTAAILNVDLDHVDYFNDIHQLRESFNKFSKNIDTDGYLVINNTIENFDTIVEGVKTNIFTFGDERADLFAANISYNNSGCATFDVILNNEFAFNLTLKVVGYHNVLNALAAIGISLIHHISPDHIVEALENFEGIDRRFQFKGYYNNVSIIDDYAHHPTEIKCTLDACKKIGNSKVWAVFQPHTYSRTYDLLNDFGDAFDDADNIVLVDIYSAREPFTDKIHSKDILDLLLNKQKNAYYFGSFEEAENFLIENAIEDDIILTMGAGNVNLIGNDILERQGVKVC